MSAMAAVMPPGCRRIVSSLLLVPLLLLLTQVVAFSMLQPDKRSKLDTHDGQHGPLDEDAGKTRTMTRSKQRRSVGRTLATPWTNGIIPYKITSGFSATQIQWIERSMRNWEQVTCVRFIPATSAHTNLVRIQYASECLSRLGMEGGEQTLELGPQCFTKGVIEHELGHTLGLIHEHQREQRDGYIKIDYDKVEPASWRKLQKYPAGVDDKMGVEYDYYSIMHYFRNELSKDVISQTIYTRDPTKEFVIGMNLKPSFLDAKVISLMYKCADTCWNSCDKDCFLRKDCKCFCKKDMPKEVCEDRNANCVMRAINGDCVGDILYMETFCRKSCHICTVDGSPPGSLCQDTSSRCLHWKTIGECENNPKFGLRACRLSCGVCEEGSNIGVSGPCIDKHPTCPEWAARGDCDTNVPFMLKTCTRSCDFCPEDVGKPPSIAGQACADYDSICQIRANSGSCKKHYNLMTIMECRRSCDNCNNEATLPEGCTDKREACRNWAYDNQCPKHEEFMKEYCRLSCDHCVHPRKICVDKDTVCPNWVKLGLCSLWIFSDFMQNYCKKACNLC